MLSLERLLREVCRRRRVMLVGLRYDYDTDGAVACVEHSAWRVVFSIFGEELMEHPCRRSRRRLLNARLVSIKRRDRILDKHLTASLRRDT